MLFRKRRNEGIEVKLLEVEVPQNAKEIYQMGDTKIAITDKYELLFPPVPENFESLLEEVIQNNTNGNITIQITGSKIPQSSWQAYSNKTGLRVDYSSSAVTIHIPPGDYILKTGLASFTEIPQNRSAAYLISNVPTSQRSPGVISVTVLDEFFNPVPDSVDVRCVQPCTIQYIACSGTSCNNVTVQTSAKLPKSQIVSAAVDPNFSGLTMTIVSVNRSVGGPYQLAYLIAK